MSSLGTLVRLIRVLDDHEKLAQLQTRFHAKCGILSIAEHGEGIAVCADDRAGGMPAASRVT